MPTPNGPKVTNVTQMPGDQYAADASVQYAYAGRYTNTGAPIISLAQFQNWFRMWANSTETSRQKMRRDYEYAEGNGKQWNRKDRELVLKQGRPVLEFNQVLPQVEFVSGLQRDMEIDYKCYPRGSEDVRLAEIATSTLKAAMDFGRVHRTSDRVFDDSIITGLGVWEVLHELEDADDLTWGDITVARINPLSFIYDPWALKNDLQDAAFMGKATWMDISEFRSRYPNYANLAVPGEWLSRVNQLIGSSDDLGTGPNLIPELWDQGTGRIRVLTMWYKVPCEIVLLVDERTGDFKEFNSKDEAEKFKSDIAAQAGREAVAPLQIVSQGATAAIADQTGMPIIDQMNGMPREFATPEMAQNHLNMVSQQAGMQILDQYRVISRTAKKPHWAEMVYWQVLDMGPTPFRDRNYPYVPLISRRWADDPESMFGIVRNIWDPQDEYNKRYSNLLSHVNSSSHSGWLNRKSGGANKSELELMGAKPGVVVEYSNVKPEQIKPVEMSQGHFAMLQTSERNILRISSINAEMLGQNEGATVSGRAIKARQSGGSTALKARFRNYEEAQLDLARMIFSRIQQYYPAEKIRRIIGISEQSMPMGPAGMSIFTDPMTGMPVPEDQVIQYLDNVTNIEFDLSFATQPFTPSEREAQFQTAMQMAAMVANSGRPIGPQTFMALIDMSNMPSKLSLALKMDAMAPPVAPPNPQGQAAAAQGQPGQGDIHGQSSPNGGGSPDGKQQAAAVKQKNSPGGSAKTGGEK